MMAMHKMGLAGLQRPNLFTRHTSSVPPTLSLHSRAHQLHQLPVLQQCHPRKSLNVSASAASSSSAAPDEASAQPVAAVAAKAPLDLVKVGVLGMMFFISCFNYTILHSLKDALVVTQIGAEALPFLGAYGVLPGSILFFLYYGWITKVLPERLHYYGALAPLLIFYAVFVTVLFPLAPILHPYHLLESFKAFLPDGLVGLAGVLVNWLYSIFFIVCELWGAVAISMLFWGLADDVCSMQEAKDVYPSLGMIANVGLIAAGAWVKYVNASLADGSTLLSLRWLVGSVLASSVGLLGLKHFVDTRYLAEAHAEAADEEAEKKKKKKKKGTKEAKDPGALSSAKDLLKRSPKVANLAMLVTAYFIVQKLFDYAWMAQLRIQYPGNTAFQSALADVSQLTGIVTIVLMGLSKYAFKYLGWGGTALVAPVTLLVMGSFFFGAAIISQYPALMGPGLAALIIPIGAVAGVAGRVLSKASKYSLFDPAKEMVFITMSKQEKTEGKAAVDLLGSYFGKSGASWMMQILVLVFGSLNRSMPFLFAVHVAVCLAWTKATMSLGSLMHSEEKAEAAAVAAAEAAELAAAAEAAKTPPAKSVASQDGFSWEDAGLLAPGAQLPIPPRQYGGVAGGSNLMYSKVGALPMQWKAHAEQLSKGTTVRGSDEDTDDEADGGNSGDTVIDKRVLRSFCDEEGDSVM